MGVPVKYYVFVDSQEAAGLVNAARLNGNLDALYACLDPAVGGLEDTNVKAGAKIVCTDRVHTITAAWTFSTMPVLPDAGIADAKLSANVMLVSAYGGKTVTNGDSHDHAGGDGAAIVEAAITLADNTTNNVSTSKHGFCPKAPNDTSQVLRGDGAWGAQGGYALQVHAAELDALDDGGLLYFGGGVGAPGAAGIHRVYIPKAGTIKVAYIMWYASGAGTGENISVYIRLNNTTDILIATIGDTSAVKIFSKTDLSIAVAQGDYFEIKVVCPTWATNPTYVRLLGTVYVE